MPDNGAIEALPPLRDVIRENGLRAEKKLGQNFILDLNLTDKIVRSAGDLSGVHALEIGPGPGGLTRSLLKSDASHVTAIEYDARAITALKPLQEAAGDRLTLVQGDALNYDYAALFEAPAAIVANLPYNIATPLMIQWLKLSHQGAALKSMTVMVQKEVAERITAQPKTKAYGRLSVIAQWLCDVDIAFHVPPSAFVPPPKVTSSIVRFRPKVLEDAQPPFEAVERVTAAAFQQRRKKIRSSLKDYAAHFEAVGLNENLRAEEVMVEDFIRLAESLSRRERDYLFLRF